jgi:hypothetical protein
MLGLKRDEVSGEWRTYVRRNSVIYAGYYAISDLLYCLKLSFVSRRMKWQDRYGAWGT